MAYRSRSITEGNQGGDPRQEELGAETTELPCSCLTSPGLLGCSSHSSISGAGETGYPHAEKMKLDPVPLSVQSQLKLTKDLNICPEILKSLQENTTRYQQRLPAKDFNSSEKHTKN